MSVCMVNMVLNILIFRKDIDSTTETKKYRRSLTKIYRLNKPTAVCILKSPENRLTLIWITSSKLTFFSLFRDHYVEGRMRGAAPNKKIPVAPQKNDVWVEVISYSTCHLLWYLLPNCFRGVIPVNDVFIIIITPLFFFLL